MTGRDRRYFLKSMVASGPVWMLAREGWLPRQCGPMVPLPETVVQPRVRIDKYVDPLPIPVRMEPTGKRGKTVLYRVRMRQFEKKLHSQLPPTKLWGYEGHYPGPIFEAQRGVPIEVEWRNELPQQHLFAVDQHIHGCMPPVPAVRTVPHLHGASTPSESDGLPEDWYTPGHSVRYLYPNEQQAATLWYHDHAMGITRLNVYAGLSGFYLLRDEREKSLGLPAGDYEIPLTIQDRTVDEQGQLLYTPTFEDGLPLPAGVWGSEFFGELPVINGAIHPYLEVEPRPYRLRILNAANARFFHLFLNLARNATDIPLLVTIQQIGTDGGLLAKPAPVEKLLMGPAERADVIVDFSSLAGKTVTLFNDARAPYPGWTQLVPLYAPLNELMEFRVTLPRKSVSKFIMPALDPIPPYDPAQAVATRDFILSERMDAQGRSLGMHINDKGYEDPVTEFPRLGTLEKWRFINTTDDSHPMHLHLVQFQILERQGYDPGALVKGKVQLEGRPRPPAANEAGWKDTAVVNPLEVLTILVRFEDYTGRYVFHCHMAEHEDNDMMRPYVVIAADASAPGGAKPA